MELERADMRARIEKALRAQAPGDYLSAPGAGGFEPFLIMRGPAGREIRYYCDDEVVSLQFGPAARHFDFSPEEEAGDGEDGDGAEAEDAEPEAKEFTEADLKALLQGVVQATLDIVQEKTFAAEFKKGYARVAKLFPAREFEALKGMKDFKGLSWKGRFGAG
jgi:hypothetical protein